MRRFAADQETNAKREKLLINSFQDTVDEPLFQIANLLGAQLHWIFHTNKSHGEQLHTHLHDKLGCLLGSSLDSAGSFATASAAADRVGKTPSSDSRNVRPSCR